jgi:hypothetical protein
MLEEEAMADMNEVPPNFSSYSYSSAKLVISIQVTVDPGLLGRDCPRLLHQGPSLQTVSKQAKLNLYFNYCINAPKMGNCS